MRLHLPARSWSSAALSALALALLAARPAAADLRLIPLAAKDLLYDPGRQRIYASVANDGTSRANSVAVIDPVAGTIGASIPVGLNPGKLALSDDGHYLYVGLDGANAVRRVDLQTGQPDLQFSVKIGQVPPYVVDDMAVVPGSPHSVAVVLGMPGISPRFAGLVIYDDGVPRPKDLDPFGGTPLSVHTDRIEFGTSASTLYGLDQSFGNAVSRLTVDATGVTVSATHGVSSFTAQDFRFAAGLLYLTSGLVVDPQTLQVAGTFGDTQTAGLVLPDPPTGRIFFLNTYGVYITGFPTLLAFDLQTHQQVAALAVPVSVPSFGVSSLIAWGQAGSVTAGGLAFRTDMGQVALLRTRLRAPAAVSADLTVTGTVLANPLAVGAPWTVQMTVANAGPDPEPGAILTSAVPAGTSFVSVTASQGRVSRSGSTITCDLGALPSGARATVTLVVRPTIAGPLSHTATVRGQTPDPYTGNNTTVQRAVAAMPVACANGTGGCLPVYTLDLQEIALPVRDLVYDRGSRRIYASLPSRAGAMGNSVVPIDPITGAVGTPIPVGSEPGKLALSDDGRYLYVALDGAAAVRRVDIPAQAAGLQFSLQSDPTRGSLYAQDMTVLPGSHDSLAVLRGGYPGSGGEGGIAIYDNGVPRGRTAGDQFFRSTALQSAPSPSRLYAFNGYYGSGFQRLAVDDLGVSVRDVTNSFIFGSNVEMRQDQGVVFAANGPIFDPEALMLLGTVTGLDEKALVAPDHAAGQAFYLTAEPNLRHLRIVASNSYLPLESLAVPDVRGRADSLIRWGQEQSSGLGGLAFLTDAGQLFLLRLSLVAPADLTLTLASGSLLGGSPTQATVTLSHPAPAGGATVLLSSGSPAVISVPLSVSVPAGATSASFSVTTRAVDLAVDVPVTASYAGVERSATLQVLPTKPPLAAFSVSPEVVPGGASTVGTVQIVSPALQGGRPIGLSTPNPAVVGIPPYVIVPPGATTASFPITTQPVTAPTYVPIWASGVTVRTSHVWVFPVGLTLNPAFVHPGQWVTATLILPGPAPAGGAVVSLSSSVPAAAPVPSSLTVPAGERLVTFYVLPRAVTATTPVVLTATYQGTSWTRSLTVAP